METCTVHSLILQLQVASHILDFISLSQVSDFPYTLGKEPGCLTRHSAIRRHIWLHTKWAKRQISGPNPQSSASQDISVTCFMVICRQGETLKSCIPWENNCYNRVILGMPVGSSIKHLDINNSFLFACFVKLNYSL